MKGENRRASSSAIEQLETRLFLAATPAPAKGGGAGGGGNGGGGGGGNPTAPAIRLDLVALHEFGHALGLDHNTNPNSIMYAYYNANYNLANFASDPAVTELRTKLAAGTTGWKNSLDANPADGVLTLTYSFMLDGAATDKGTTNTFASFNAKFGAGNWQSIFVNELNRWAGVSEGKLAFTSFDTDGIENAIYSFNAAGSAQNDTRFGDIRIATHRFDGAGKTLAHTYFPPPNGVTAAGDAHFDYQENWVLAPASSGSSTTTTTSATSAASSGSSVGASTFSNSRLILSLDADHDDLAF